MRRDAPGRSEGTVSVADGRSDTYWRVPFVLAGDAAPRRLADPPGVSWSAAEDDEELTTLFARALEASIDPRDAMEVRRAGARAVAARMIEDPLSGRRYECQREWWWVVAVDGEAAGVVLPVVLSGCAREGLDEVTLYHIGVVAEQRARGLGHLLLGRATDTLLAHGVWQISCDTAVENAAMIRLFELHNGNGNRRPEVAGGRRSVPRLIEPGRDTVCRGLLSVRRSTVGTQEPSVSKGETMTTLENRPNTALLVVDVQNGVVAGAHERDSVVANVANLVDKARRDRVPVVWVQHSDEQLVSGSDDWRIVAELTPADAEPLVAKNYGDSFEDTTLETVLSGLGVGRLVVVGAQTDACIRSTLHGALVRGYDATLVSDAHTTEDQTEWGAPPPDQVIAHTNLYWTYQTAPGRTAGTVETKDVDFGTS